MKKLILVLVACWGALMTSPAFSSFYTAKKEARAIYLNHMQSFYTGCTMYAIGKKLLPDLVSCDYQIRKSERRAKRIEWEHVVPASHLGLQLQCWQEGGRKNCKKTSPEFVVMESDLHNLVPVIGELNGDRSNFRYGLIAGEFRQYGQAVDFEVDFKQRLAEPKASVRGDIARIYFYMRDRYGITLSDSQTQLFEAWSKTDPVDEWERDRNEYIKAVQGHGNPYVSPMNSESSVGFRCLAEKRYCRDMVSCEEATYYLNVCGRTRLDGNKDGIPCNAFCR